jgi:hypothetical protein
VDGPADCQDGEQHDRSARLGRGGSDLRAAVSNAQIDLIAGNHDVRIFKHLADTTPAMLTLLSDLHGFTIRTLL